MSDMTYRQLSRSGLTVSTVGLGCNAFGSRIDPDRTFAVVRAALDAGITFFDTGDVYGSTAGESETLLGRALGSDRDDVIVATKFGSDTRGANGPDWGVRGSRRYVRKAVEASLRRLGTDWIDLYQLHEPDPHTPIAETLHTLGELVAEGKIRYTGSSKFAARDPARAGHPERRRRDLAADRRGPGRARRGDRPMTLMLVGVALWGLSGRSTSSTPATSIRAGRSTSTAHLPG